MRVTLGALGRDAGVLQGKPILPASLSPEHLLKSSLPFTAPKEGKVALRGRGWGGLSDAGSKRQHYLAPSTAVTRLLPRVVKAFHFFKKYWKSGNPWVAQRFSTCLRPRA